ncbi:hypothetical protein DS885_07135 [Psychromonas sp. B3M02]|uniref:hypothetical protein n=1 Tax=Psychromonas sp. B3M02 TaxID=2267226 RepID=UPI000DEB4AD7|nr:hypothetical protein [Psychromonas sp. B3M02]RBW46661.1 hypothetical protein DS885_07135 [Psychromonas sp. B3M02]
MKKMKTLLFALCVAPLIIIDSAHSDTMKMEQCSRLEINQIYQHDQSKNPQTTSQLYGKQITTLNNIAEKEGLHTLSIIPVNPEHATDDEIIDKSELAILMTFTGSNDNQILDKINADLKPLNFTYSSLILKKVSCNV